jgi:hypothetical protein
MKDLAGESRRCPRCGSSTLRPAASPQAKLLCTACHRCWSPEHGYLIEVNRYACAGCDDRGLCNAAPGT